MARAWQAIGVLLILTGTTTAQPGPEPRVPVGKNLSPEGMLLTRTRPDRPWQFAEPGAEIATRDRLLALPGTQAVVETQNGKLAVTLWGNVPQFSPFAGFQSEVVLHDSRAFDLDLTLVCGRILLTNKKAGPVKVWVRLPGLVAERTRPPEIGAIQLTFAAAGDSVALEIHGRWQRGVPFALLPKANVAPTSLLNVLVLKGRVELQTDSYQYALNAPPGPASLIWDSESGPGSPQQVEKLPDWVTETTPGRKVFAEVLQRYETARKGRAPLEALLALIADSAQDKNQTRAVLCRQFAVLSLAALEELVRVVGAVELARWPEVRDVAIVALRHHIGEMPGRDVALYQVLTGSLNYPEATAEAYLQLLHNPFDPEQAETYATLLAYLRHPRTAIRELARWHLERRLPEGKKLGFDATADEASRDRAIQAWKKLIDERPKK